MKRKPTKDVNGIPALVLVPSGKKVLIGKKWYRVLDMFYDLKGEYSKPAMRMG